MNSANDSAQDPDRDVELVRIGENRRARQKSSEYRADVGLGDENLEQETARDGRDQRNDERFEQEKAFLLHVEDDQYIERCDRDAPRQRNVEQQIERDG